MGKVKQVNARRAVTITSDEYQMLIDTLGGEGDGGEAVTAGEARKKGHTEPCALVGYSRERRGRRRRR